MYSVCHKKHNKTQKIKLIIMLSFLIYSIKYARFMYGTRHYTYCGYLHRYSLVECHND